MHQETKTEATKLPQDYSAKSRWARDLNLGLCDLRTCASCTDCMRLTQQLTQVAQKSLCPAQSHIASQPQS